MSDKRDTNGFTDEERRLIHSGNLRRDTTTFPGEEVPPSVRANMSEEALAIERQSNMPFDEMSKVIKEATLKESGGKVGTEKDEKFGPVSARVEISQAAAAKAIPEKSESEMVAVPAPPAAPAKK